MIDRLEKISREIAKFAEEREWEQFHIPRSLVLSLMAEVGELAEVLQWKRDDEVIEFLNSDGE